MAVTQITTRQIGSVQKNDFDITTTGQAVVTKLIAGTNISFTSTGVDAGTGEVTINATGGGGGISTVGSVSGSGDAEGASISGSVLTLHPATDTTPGIVTTEPQTFAGNKAFEQLSVGDMSLTSSGTTYGLFNNYTAASMLMYDSLDNSYSIAEDIIKIFLGDGIQVSLSTSFDGTTSFSGATNHSGIVSMPGIPSGTKSHMVYFDTATNNLSYGVVPASGVTSMAAIGSVPNANGASISSGVLTLQPANNTFGGVVTTTDQTWTGVKTFNSSIIGSIRNGNSGFAPFSSEAIIGSSTAALQIGGSSTISAYNNSRNSVNNIIAVNDAFSVFLFGQTAVTEAASGTHPLLTTVAIKPLTITGGAAATTNSASLYIEGAATGATNNYALWVDDGTSRFDGALHAFDGDNLLANGVRFRRSGDSTVTSGYLVGTSTTTHYSNIFDAATLGVTMGVGSSFTNTLFGTTGVSKATSGTHDVVAGTSFFPVVITGGAATVTNSTAVYIKSASTGATNNYALWVDDGIVRVDGNLELNSSLLLNSTSSQVALNGTTLLGTSSVVSETWAGVSSSTKYKNTFNNGFNSLAANESYVDQRFISSQSVTEAASGVHNLIAKVGIKPIALTDGVATTTNAATLYIEGATTGTATITNNYALWVDTGTTRLDGALELQGIASATKTNVLYYDTTTKVVSYGAASAGGGVALGDSPTWTGQHTFTTDTFFTANIFAEQIVTDAGNLFDLSNNSSGGGFRFNTGNTLGYKAIFMANALNTADRTYTMPDATGTIALLSGTQTFTGATTFSNSTVAMSAIPNTLKADVLYYDSTTKAISYGIAPVPPTSIVRNYYNPSTNFTVFTTGSAADHIYFAINTITGTLSDAAGNTDKIVIKNKGTGIITLITVSSQTIDGSASITIDPMNSVTLLSDGSNWYII